MLFLPKDVMLIIEEYCFIETIIINIKDIYLEYKDQLLYFDSKLNTLCKQVLLCIDVPLYRKIIKTPIDMYIESNIFFTNIYQMIQYSNVEILLCKNYNCDIQLGKQNIYCEYCSGMDLNYYFDRKNCRLCTGMKSYRFPDLKK